MNSLLFLFFLRLIRLTEGVLFTLGSVAQRRVLELLELLASCYCKF